MSALAPDGTAHRSSLLGRSTLLRSLGLVLSGVVSILVSGALGAYNACSSRRRLLLRRARRADDADRLQRPDLARARRADGGRRLHGDAADRQRGLGAAPALVAAVVVTASSGSRRGAAASRCAGPYLAGATLAFAVGLPALADRFPATFGGENGLTINPPTPPSWLGANFSLEHWEAWIAAPARWSCCSCSTT
jgi:ABC-type branched-subunit amino acid transport system permease subunit